MVKTAPASVLFLSMSPCSLCLGGAKRIFRLFFQRLRRNFQKIGNSEIGAVSREVVYFDIGQLAVDDLSRIEQRIIGAKQSLFNAFAGFDIENSPPQDRSWI